MEFKEPTPSENLFSLEMVEKMCRGNKDKVSLMVKTFISTIVTSLDEFKEAYKNKDLLSIQRIAHRIKPTLSVYGVVWGEQYICQLEKCEELAMSPTALENSLEKLHKLLLTVIHKMQIDYPTN
jgi:HPt (histidine-containing phosphotransfer) domain-containing protein